MFLFYFTEQLKMESRRIWRVLLVHKPKASLTWRPGCAVLWYQWCFKESKCFTDVKLCRPFYHHYRIAAVYNAHIYLFVRLFEHTYCSFFIPVLCVAWKNKLSFRCATSCCVGVCVHTCQGPVWWWQQKSFRLSEASAAGFLVRLLSRAAALPPDGTHHSSNCRRPENTQNLPSLISNKL